MFVSWQLGFFGKLSATSMPGLERGSESQKPVAAQLAWGASSIVARTHALRPRNRHDACGQAHSNKATSEMQFMEKDSREASVGFVGLGDMGGPMTVNLLKAGLPVVAYDLNEAKVKQAAKCGAQAGTSASGVARRASVMISMVDTTAQADEVIVGPDGFIESAQPGDLVISMSTIDPVALQHMHAKLAAKGVALIDAPVSGMDKGAREGTLKAFVGGDVASLERARPVLQAMCSEITHIGAIGQGCVMKMINNMLAQINRIVVAEALVLGAKAGLDPKVMFDLIGKATGNSAAFQIYAPRMIAHDFKGSRMDITFKDMELQTALGKSLKVPLFMATIAQQVCQMGRAAGYGSEDGSAVVKVYEKFAGVSLAQE
jgi:3-hydroxyisobutyrate dehydrogenase-like beta-hydroxyacid dehydrogenase